MDLALIYFDSFERFVSGKYLNLAFMCTCVLMNWLSLQPVIYCTYVHSTYICTGVSARTETDFEPFLSRLWFILVIFLTFGIET